MSQQFKKVVNVPDNRPVILKAIDILATPVKRTLGPEGLPILLQREQQSPLNTKDGVTVAKSICVEEPDINCVIEAIKEAAIKTNELVGDGNTTAILLAEGFIREGFKLIEMDMIKPQELVGLMAEKTKEIVQQLKDITVQLEDEKQRLGVALISSNNDQEIAEKVTEALDRAGEDGVITCDEGTSSEIELLHVEGFQLDSGFHKIGSAGFEFITHPDRQMGICENPHILMYNGELNDVNDLANFLVKHTNNGKDVPPGIVIIAHEFSGPVLGMAISNRQQHFPIFLVKTPVVGSKFFASRPLILKDLSAFLGGEVVPPGEHAFANITKIDNYSERFLGTCSKMEISKDTSTFFEGGGEEEEKKIYLQSLKKQHKDATSDWDKDLVKQRIGRMVDGIVVIYSGGRTELEMKEKKDRIEDALNATKAAIQEGVLPGGGCALNYVKDLLGDGLLDLYFKKVLTYPIRQIYENAGLQTDVILTKIDKRKKDDVYFGYDVKKRKFVDNMLEAGVIDPFKVTKFALYNAVSIATQMLISGGIVSHKSTESE